MLREIDPEAAEQIHANNRKRVIRAIEYFRLTGQPISEHNRQEREKTSPYRFYYYVLTCRRDLLYEHIDRRVEHMMENGLVEEVRRLKEMGCHRGMVSMQGLGYKEILDYLDGRCSLEETVRILKGIPVILPNVSLPGSEGKGTFAGLTWMPLIMSRRG